MKHQIASNKIGRACKRIMYLLILPILLNSCSDSPVSFAEKQIAEQVTSYSNGYLEMSDFKKIDAVEREHRGTKMYELRYEVEVLVLKDGGWINLNESGELMGKGSTPFDSQIRPFSVFDNECEGDFVLRKCKNTQIQKGQKFKGQSLIRLEKHEQGWVAL